MQRVVVVVVCHVLDDAYGGECVPFGVYRVHVEIANAVRIAL